MLGSIVGGIAQYSSAKKAAAAQASALAEQRARLDGISVPEAKRLIVEELISQGNLTPELQEAFELPDSEVAQIQEDASIRQNQVQALELIKQRAQGGLTMADRADFNTIRNQTARDAQAKQEQILQQMQARGMGGSGAELIAQLSNAQNSAQQASEEGDRIAAAASRQAMEAALQMGSQSGALREQDFQVANTKATAQDEYNRFNTANRQNVANANVAARNGAQQYNLGERQRLHEQNIGNRRDEDLRYAGAQQQEFQNKWSKATGLNSISAAQGNNEANKHLAKGQVIGAVGKAFDDTGMEAAKAYATGGASLAKKWDGGEIEGEAPIAGDHPANDIQPAMLSPGEVVLPRSVTQSENPSKEASKFMKSVEQKRAFDAANFLAKFIGKKGN